MINANDQPQFQSIKSVVNVPNENGYRFLDLIVFIKLKKTSFVELTCTVVGSVALEVKPIHTLDFLMNFTDFLSFFL